MTEKLTNTTTNETEIDIESSPNLSLDKIYFPPKHDAPRESDRNFGNPTPVAILGLCIALTPLSVELMGWRGAAGFPATNGGNYFFGGMLLILSGIGEFLLGNTFPSAVFMAYGANFLTLAVTFTPSYSAISAYTTDGSQTQTPPFWASFGFYFLSMSLLNLIFLVCSFRTNAVFVFIFTNSLLGFLLATGGFWNLAGGHAVTGARLLVGTGGCFFAASLGCWYFLLAGLLVAVDMPFTLPVLDLSTIIKGRSDRQGHRSD